MEQVLSGVTKMFMDYQERCEERFLKYEEKRAREERAHEERLFQLLLSSQQPRHSLVPPVPPTHWYYNQCHDAYPTETNDDQ